MEVIYIIHDGYIYKNRHERTKLRAGDVARLYGVNFRKCIVATNSMVMKGLREGDDVLHVHLHPDSSGEYNLQKEITREIYRRKNCGKYEY